MVTRAQVSRLAARIDAIVTARQPPGGRQVVIMSPFKEDDDAAVARHCAAHPEERSNDGTTTAVHHPASMGLPVMDELKDWTCRRNIQGKIMARCRK
jgi:hypothetical protein